MQNIDHLLLNLLNLKESDVERIDSSSDDEGNVSYFVTVKATNPVCPLCHSKSDLISKGYYDKDEIISHDLFKSSTVKLRLQRRYCSSCHHTFHAETYGCPPNSSISYEVITKVMDLLKEPSMTFKMAASLTGISETSVIRIFDKHCHLQRVKFPEVICIDEVYTKNNDYDSKYSCIFYDFFRGKIVDVLPDRKKDYLTYYFKPFEGSKELDNVKYVSIDMYKTYKIIASRYFKKAAICVDSFHVVKLLNDCFSKVRLRLLNSYDTSTDEYHLLKKWSSLLFRFDLEPHFKKKMNHRFNRYMNYYDILQMILNIDDDLKNGYELVKMYYSFNQNSTYDEAKKKFSEIYNEFVKFNIPEFVPFITALSNWKDEIINSFIVYKGRRINSSVAESINSRVSTVLSNSKGIRNNERRKKRIMYCINKEGFLLK